MPRLFDCFLFSGEHDLLDIRLNILDPIIDKFVIVESDYTFSNQYKGYKLNVDPKFKSKIIYLKATLPKIGRLNNYLNPWSLEHYGRNYLYYSLKDIGNNDLVLLSDLDEIPNPDILKLAINNNNFPVGLNLKNFIYFFNVIINNEDRYLPSAVCMLFKKEHLIWPKIVDDFSLSCNNIGFMKMREDRLKYPLYQNAGWHYSSCLGVYELIEKLQSYAMYGDFKENIVNFDYLLECKTNLISYDKNLKLEEIKINKENTHSYILDNKDKWPHLFYKS